MAQQWQQIFGHALTNYWQWQTAAAAAACVDNIGASSTYTRPAPSAAPSPLFPLFPLSLFVSSF